jgi:hypothetical protein
MLLKQRRGIYGTCHARSLFDFIYLPAESGRKFSAAAPLLILPRGAMIESLPKTNLPTY